MRIVLVQLALGMGLATSLCGIIPFNMYTQSDPLLNTYLPPDRSALFMLGSEYIWNTTGYLAGSEDGIVKEINSKGNVLQLWQKQQNGIAALAGLSPLSLPSSYAQELFRDDDNGTHGIFTPCANMDIPINLLLAARAWIPHGFICSAYIPYRVVKLNNIRWYEENPRHTFEQRTTPPLIALIEQLGGMDLTHNWTRHGFGDLVVRIERYTSFPQMREWLHLVNINVRAGMRFPTGLKADNAKLLALSFGFDQGPGFLAGGRLELCYPHGMVLGVDGELLHLFGNLTTRRVKTNAEQTDLLLINQTCVFTNPGFVQSFTLFLEKVARGGGLFGRLGYYYTKQTEETLYPCSGTFDTTVINNAESVQDWTAHALAFTLGYDWGYRTDLAAVPSVSAYVNYGFNGKRAILANSVGVTVAVSF